MTNDEIITNTTSWFLDALNYAECMFGARDKEWTYVGLEFRDNGPYIYYYPNKRISIVLSTGCINYPLQFIYQLSHEVCHLLYPTGKADANNLNEGISTFFSKIYQEKHFPESVYAIENIVKSRYFNAYNIINQIMVDDPRFVFRLREINDDISNITFDQIKEANVDIADETIFYLLKKFE
ncbi:hypothetical protein MTO98_33725 [Mucilaginibacter sp. SMC90]|uniref:hypothetical protein n=1 Tax=Mucilaginibacter sp. SMC90 TaxID=2929803 RepID=UPI001FB4BD10|nr:hypothetical protein [Mucilaginibacter sp. SMC90]UOE49356.1 hypothetical protein MTO98_33725 [Mucilaginibacter sp. SMC90]